MYEIWYQFFLEHFFNNTLPTIEWQVNFIEITSVVMCCVVVLLAILFIVGILAFIINLARGLFR